MAKTLPYFRWYPKDAICSDAYMGMSMEQIGMYHVALNWAWLHEGLPTDKEDLCRLFRLTPKRFDRLWSGIKHCWIEEDGRYVNPRQEEERAAALKKSQGNSVAAAHAQSKSEGFVYLIRRQDDGAVKIGSAVNVPRRLAQLKHRYRDHGLILVASYEVPSMGDSELALHAKYAEKRLAGEWFALTARDLMDIFTTLQGDSGGDSNNHPALRASGSDSESTIVSLSQKTPTASDLNGHTSQRFEDWWALWSKTRGTFNKIAACQAYVSVVSTDNEAQCFECTASYLRSLKDPSNGFNPDNFLFRQARENFASRWVPRAKTRAEVLNELESSDGD